MNIEHWMTFGTFAEQRYFIYPTRNTYYGVIVNANMAAHAPDGLAAFLLEKTAHFRYLIDPLTHAFQHHPSAVSTLDEHGDRVVRSSIQKLALAYGEPFRKMVGVEPLLPDALLKSPRLVQDFVGRCLEFQSSQIAKPMSQSDALKYFDGPVNLRPYALVAPYFFMTETTLSRHWIPVNKACIEAAISLKGRHRLYAAIVVSQGVVTSHKARTIVARELGNLPVDGFLIWVDDLNEYEAGLDELTGVLALARELRNGNKRDVINLHGGYFSILAGGVLGSGCLTGVAHGPEFGEHRAVVPVGGGIPIARYYVPKLHLRCRYGDAVAILTAKKWLSGSAKDFHKRVCSCDACKQVLDGAVANFTRFGESNVKMVKRRRGMVRMEFPTAEAKINCLKHYLEIKNLEYKFSSTASQDDILENLKQGLDEFQSAAGIEGVAHLERWKQVLTEL